HDMKKHRLTWSRLLLWSHVIGVIGFYILLWLRTKPGKESPVVSNAEKQTAGTPPQTALPPVSVIVPARNEERNIARCVTSLLEQGYPDYEVIVVDDDSTDETPRILDELARSHSRGDRLWVLRLRALPPHWAGKPHAIHSGAQEAHGEWLLFTDADTWHAPDALSSAVARATADHLDLLTLGAQQELPGFWNKVLMPMAYLGIGMQYPIDKVNDPRSSVAIANGQFILMRRATYEQLGGYARPDLRETLLDDRDLARVVKQSGHRMRFVDGRGLVHVRMYSGLRESWRGWRKNVFLGSRGGILFTLLQLIGLPVVSIAPFMLPILAWLLRLSPAYRNRRRRGGITTGEAGLAAVLELSSLLAYRCWIDKELGVPWYYALTK
ncbi:MAG TPA: glycosyltransferase family 2 protein, partial [Chthonomonadales bacterium]|nr:glycosyltransferase family 2 protein [Chthonomonadales bacterium]